MKAGDHETWLREVISRISGKSAAKIGIDEDLHEAVGLDSLGRLEVLAEVEDKFDFFLEDNDLNNASTIAKMLGAIDRKLQETAGAQA